MCLPPLIAKSIHNPQRTGSPRRIHQRTPGKEIYWTVQIPICIPLLLHKKKDGKLWLVQDYRQLNEWTIPNNYPLPLIRDIIPCLAGKKYLTSVDVHKGYNNILIQPEDWHKAAFKTDKGFFQPKVMYIGMWNAPATFQSMMDTIFRD